MGFPEVSGCLPGRRVCVAGRRGLSGAVLRGPGPGSRGTPALRTGAGGADAEASGFELRSGAEGKNKEGVLSKGDPSLRGSPFPWRKKMVPPHPFLSCCSQFPGVAVPIAASFVGFIGGEICILVGGG